MDFQAFFIGAADGAFSQRSIVPADGFSVTLNQRNSDGEALTGRLYGYRWPAALLGYTVPLTAVDSATRADFTAWWRSQQELLFSINGSSSSQQALVRLVNAEEPLGQPVPGVSGRYRGVLMLRETRGLGPVQGNPFVLDDPSLGLLDQAANVLV
jgi:hypothetical protein